MTEEMYQKIVEKSLKYLEEMKELEKISNEVLSQLGLSVTPERRRAANILAWLLELYVRKVGEIEVLKRWRQKRA